MRDAQHPEPGSAPAPDPPRPDVVPRWQRGGKSGSNTLGVVMIVRDEAHNLPALFETIRDVADEVVVVDTGSADGTRDVCREWGVKLVQQPWGDDFAAARNRSIAEAGAAYLLWLDADDRLPPRTRAELQGLRDRVLPGSRKRAYRFQVRSLDRDGQAFGVVGGVFAQTRLFPRVAGARFRRAVHEEIDGSLKALGVELVPTDLVVEHVGYASPEVRRAKAERNEALLRAELSRDPGNVSLLLHMAMTLRAQERHEEAERALSDALSRLGEARSHPRLQAEIHVLRASYRQALHDRAGARSDLERAVALWPGWSVPCVALAGFCLDERDLGAAWALIEKARGGAFSPGILGHPAAPTARNLELFSAVVLRARGDLARATECLRRAHELGPHDLDVRLMLGQALLDAGDDARARDVLEPAGDSEAGLERFVDVAVSIALARARTGDAAGAGACLAPLLDLLADRLSDADEAGPLEMAEALLGAGYPDAARNMISLFQATLRPAA